MNMGLECHMTENKDLWERGNSGATTLTPDIIEKQKENFGEQKGVVYDIRAQKNVEARYVRGWFIKDPNEPRTANKTLQQGDIALNPDKPDEKTLVTWLLEGE